MVTKVSMVPQFLCPWERWGVWCVVHDIGIIHVLLSLQDGWTPLMLASGNGHVECVLHLLLDRGANVNHQSNVSLV